MQYEYTVVYLPQPVNIDEMENWCGDVSSGLSKLGEEGWEVIHIQNSGVFHLKRNRKQWQAINDLKAEAA